MLAFQGTVEGEQDPAWQLDTVEVRTISWIDPASLIRERTHRLLWKALRTVGLIAAPTDA
jgi:hypothetical protein